MRILCLSPFLPYPPEDGARVRMWHVIKGLADSHDVEILSLADSSERSLDSLAALHARGFAVHAVLHQVRPMPSALRSLVRQSSYYAARHYSRTFARLVESRLRDHPPDLVHVDFYYMARYRPKRRASAEPKWVLHEHNVEFELARSLAANRVDARGAWYRRYANREARLRMREEIRACRAVDHVVTLTNHDRGLLQKAIPGLSVTTVPIGVDLAYFQPTACRTDAPPRAVYVGTMDYRPNAEAVVWFCREILPLVKSRVPTFEFVVVGSNPPEQVRRLEARCDGVKVTGWVPDVRPVVQDASLVVVPLLAGSGLRVKILDAMAMSMPIVTTSIGCQGMELIDGVHALIRDDPHPFAEAILAVLDNPVLREQLGMNGRRLVEQHYHWPQLIEQVDELYRELVGERASVPETAADGADG